MNKLNIGILVLSLTFIGCSKSKNKTADTNKKISESNSPKKAKPLATSVPSNLDVKFETFIHYFNKDSLYQISRIQFPLKVKELNDDFKLAERIIQKSEFRKMDFSYDKSKANKVLDGYKQNIKVQGNRAVIEIRGIQNGIIADYYFEKINGKWTLITWTDSSN